MPSVALLRVVCLLLNTLRGERCERTVAGVLRCLACEALATSTGQTYSVYT